MAAESEDNEVTEFTEKNDKIANGVDKQKENNVLLIQIRGRNAPQRQKWQNSDMSQKDYAWRIPK